MSLPALSSAFSCWLGPHRPKILLVGEAFGGDEDLLKKPFVGTAGKELFLMLGEAGFSPAGHREIVEQHRYGLAWVKDRESWFHDNGIAATNVFNMRPPGNKIEEFCGKKADMPKDYGLPPLAPGKYFRPEYLPEVDRLREEIRAAKPNLVVAMGNTACWAILGKTNISGLRGAIAQAEDGQKVLPTYHPASTIYQFSHRPILVADLMKAKREGEFPEVRRPARRIIVDPTFQTILNWSGEALREARILSCDIETEMGQIKCIGFSWRKEEALVIPFIDWAKPEGHFWPSLREELLVWDEVARLLESPIPKLGQNFIYDLQYITKLGIRPKACLHDTMLLHHSHFPEVKKSLGFLGSIYTNEPAWKLMTRKRKADESNKADE